MDQSKFEDVKYVIGEDNARLAVNDSLFNKMDVINQEESVYEVIFGKKHINQSMPSYLGFWILNLAKLRMLEFVYDLLFNFFQRSHLQLCQTDTDSLYFAIAAPSLEHIFRNDEMKNRYHKSVYGSCNDLPYLPDAENNYVTRSCCSVHEQKDRYQFGLYKKEYEGSTIVCLCSKCYVCDNNDVEDKGNDGVKFSSKGLNREALLERAKDRKLSLTGLYKRVLDTGVAEYAINAGIKCFKNNVMTYTQSRAGLSFLYCKRVVGQDGISTSPLNVTLIPYKLAKKDKK